MALFGRNKTHRAQAQALEFARAPGGVGRLRALVRFFRDPSASVFGKLFVLLAVVYVVCPVDLIPDVPIVGWLDDLGVASLAMAYLARTVARYRHDPALMAEPVPVTVPVRSR